MFVELWISIYPYKEYCHGYFRGIARALEKHVLKDLICNNSEALMKVLICRSS